jgi:hypothetical protein
MAKDPKVRWDATIKYLDEHFADLGDHVNTVVQDEKTRLAISRELSLEAREAKLIDRKNNNKDQRHALRSLLLCQRVYYSDLWAHRTTGMGDAAKLVSKHFLGEEWKKQSLEFWSKKSEADIQKGIGMFVPNPDATEAELIRVAHVSKPNSKVALPGNLTLSRADTTISGDGTTCYMGVLSWLLASGIVSMRWMMRDATPGGKTSLDRLVGEGKTVWNGVQIKDATDVREAETTLKLKPGYIYHMWNADTPGMAGWNGHWVICNADGKTISGVNNGESHTHDVNKSYTINAPFFSQFEGYYGETEDPRTKEKKHGTPMLVQHNPLKLKDRM